MGFDLERKLHAGSLYPANDVRGDILLLVPVESLVSRFGMRNVSARIASELTFVEFVLAVGQLGLSEAGRLGITCSCHGIHMSVAKFSQVCISDLILLRFDMRLCETPA